jgi:putative pyruvate formate lyase activating enzyme
MEKIIQAYSECCLCPRNCGVNRLKGELGYCKENSQLRISSASLHHGEEAPISGRNGSGTVFITGCNLGCLFCQNWDISLLGNGRNIDENGLVRIFLDLQSKRAENINLVTPTHAAPALAAGINAARKKGLNIPLVWNTSAYENIEIYSMFEKPIDIWLPDLKTLDSSIAEKYFNAPDYPQTAHNAILYMIENSKLDIDKFNGKIYSGVIIRHLALPGHLDASREVIQWFAEHANGRAILSLLTQYTPVNRYSKDCPARRISMDEVNTLGKWLKEFRIDKVFFQG